MLLANNVNTHTHKHTHTQIAAGLFQSTGWPSVVSIVANWSGKGKRGLIMGIWNANTSVGNIVGTVTAAALLSWVGEGQGCAHGAACGCMCMCVCVCVRTCVCECVERQHLGGQHRGHRHSSGTALLGGWAWALTHTTHHVT